MVYRDPTWLTQTAWHVDFDHGNDANDGKTQATALLTLKQLFFRVGREFRPEQDVDIYLYGNNKPTDPWDTEWSFNAPRSPVFYPPPAAPLYPFRQIRVHAMSRRVYYTGVFSAVQIADWTTNTPYLVTDVNMKGANETPPVPPPNDTDFWYNQQLNWFDQPRGTNHDQQRCRITSGPRANAVAWTASANLGAYGIIGGGQNGIIRTSNWCLSVPFGYTAGYVTVGVTPVVPQAGDHYVVEELQLLYLDRLISRGNGDLWGSGLAFNGFNFRLVNGGDSQAPSNVPPLTIFGGSAVFIECNFDFDLNVGGGGSATFAAFSYFINCSGIDGIFISGGGSVCYVDAGQYHLALGAADGATMITDGDVMITTGAIYTQRNGQVWVGSTQIWDLPGHARKAGVMCFDHGTTFFFGNGSFYNTNRLWGIDQTGVGPPFVSGRAYAIAAFDGGRFFYNPDVPGIQNMMTIDGRAKWFGIGLSWTRGETAQTIDPVTGALTTFRDTTKARFFDTVAALGFGGRAIDLDTGGLIAPYTSPTKPTA